MHNWRPFGRHWKVLWGGLLVLLSVFVCGGIVDAREPTEQEQYFLELLNRARADPGAEVTRLSSLPWGGNPDLNEGVESIPLVDQPYQPLAFSSSLLDAAGDYADLLIANHADNHFYGGTNPSGRMTTAGYSFTPAPGGGTEILASSEEATYVIDKQLVDSHWSQVFINSGVFGRVDRISLLREEYREIGVGTSNGPGVSFGTTPPANPVDALTVAKIAYNSGDPFLTGVLFDDRDSDGFYTPGTGEALGAVSVEVYNSDSKLFETTFDSFASGGYSVQLEAGIYDLVIHDPLAGDQFVYDIVLGNENVKFDYVRSAIPEPSGALLLGFSLLLVAARRRRRRS